MMPVKNRLAKILARFGCSACLVANLAACEAVPTEQDVVEKELAGKVSVGIRPIETQLLPGAPMEVLFYLNNATDSAITILPWGTPLETNMTADRFAVTHDGEVIPYSGPVVKRPAPRAEDYVTLTAGEKREAVVLLADGYDVGTAGDYEIALKEFVFQSPNGELLTPVVVELTIAVTRQ